MSAIAIRAEGLGKAYRLVRGGRANPSYTYKRFSEEFLNLLAAPLRRLGGSNGGESEASFWALRDVTFEIERGEVVGLIGRNGAGKSTLLKVLSRITAPTEGVAEIHGRVGSLLEVGTGFHPELSGRQNIFLSGAIMGMTRTEIQRKFDEIVSFAEVERFIDMPAKRYSSGMYVRLAFAVAAHLEPEILLVDEVLAVGDAAFQRKSLGKMGSVAREGRTVIFVSHNMGAITGLTQTAICLDRGHIVDQGETARVVEGYLSRVTEEASNQGYADLTHGPRIGGSRESAILKSVRLLNSYNNQTNTFFEREPITIEIGFRVLEPIANAEFAFNIRTVDNGTSLFMSPSGERHEELVAGEYTIRATYTPNFLRQGAYSLALYMFVVGQKMDVVSPAIQFTIEPRLEEDDNPFHLRWGTGFFRFDDHPWGDIQFER